MPVRAHRDGFQASVIATYCCYFPFYEDVILRRLFDRGCTNNILMVDSGLCAEAFASDDTRPRRAGLPHVVRAANRARDQDRRLRVK
jgi:hypothetical protein